MCLLERVKCFTDVEHERIKRFAFTVTSNSNQFLVNAPIRTRQSPVGKIPQGRVTKRAIVVAVWLTASTNTQPADRYYVIEKLGSARYGYETGYARTGPHLEIGCCRNSKK
ncbi:hypothetical protein R3W88_002512 [Solanum pinnatisectum]|uniref:Uncharacterized protein n=1 Tax=Solanum pinnatisectum TaxID=50273 RepID=A0AAV9MPN0_9SOLN|nr:hypothetical protein R3W88_002512 [Solanum pinnatisectum]